MDHVEVLAFETTRGSRGGRPRPHDDLRWTEMTIYRTPEGYVLTKVGRSDVYHAPDRCMTPSKGRLTMADDLDEDYRPCPKCEPAARKKLLPYAIVIAEVDVPDVTYAATPDELIQAVEMTDSASGKPYVPVLASRVLETAAKQDPGLAHAWRNRNTNGDRVGV